MFNDRISDYFEGVAAKYLSAVDADPGRSHQHEIGGLPAAGFKQWLGTPGKTEEFRFRARQIYMSDESEAPLICHSDVTWYDSRRKVAHRGPEYRLYYYDSPVTEQLSPGDFFLVAKLKDGTLLMVFAPAGSSIENQLRTLFGLGMIDERFRAGTLDTVSLLLPLRLMLEDLGIELNKPALADDQWLSRLVDTFGGMAFPGTADFSRFARESIAKDMDPIAQPDDTLISWMDHEEKLFRIYERHLVQDRLRAGFGDHGDDVDEFISFSLSVQNRRKSRVGHAFEGHLDHLFRLHKLKFQQGRGKGHVTENNAKPDFLFPSFTDYNNPDFPTDNLIMLGAKTTCKDRWRQVLSEAARIPSKHLVTLEAAISEAQTDEMASHNLKLVIPATVHATYSEKQKHWLLDLQEFIQLTKKTQN
ncbi:type II restriction endonuclease [Pseudogulbenkiania sp. NH8B]|uniref:type II restriction endonuclease n=1 Tax=Pseudogulbenkiania sp. (strain NH8B) TaxID=748280 RepID=UPI00022796F0|nr:type II restriction endonuclease [Pseudogulbenkiania sp. NH8B]BAK74857.1 type II restriction endonuclease [Pseudogulbenkiania sp. NH8B]